jgi:hypothetical protein
MWRTGGAPVRFKVSVCQGRRNLVLVVPGSHRALGEGNGNRCAGEKAMASGRKRKRPEASGEVAAIYHRVYMHEGFEEAAQALFKLVQQAQELRPNQKRKLFLDIDGHRNEQGGFDADMYELQTHFLLGFLARFLTEFSCPLASGRNEKGQENDLPEALHIRPEESQQG